MSKSISSSVPRSLSIARGIILELRPWQWAKNLLVFLPLVFSMGERWTLGNTGLLAELTLRSVAAFFILCALSGGVYIINDIFDREQDRLHPRKRNRPIASGLVPVNLARLVAAVAIIGSLVGSWFMGIGLFAVALTYLAINVLYSSYIKHIALLDVLVLSSGFILRIVAGSVAVDVVTSPWLYTTVGSGALFLVLGKRYTELRSAGDKAIDQRSVLGQYSQELLNQLLTITATSTLLAYGLYTFAAANVPDNKSLMITIPFVVYGLFRFLYILHNTNEGESPELVLMRDKSLVLNVALWAATAVIVLALYK